MTAAFSFRGVTKRFGRTTALDGVTLDVAPNHIVGLIGKNGSGKSTMLRHVVGLQLPTSGECLTLGAPTAALDAAELSRIGVVHQDDKFLTWMRVEQQIGFVASFHERWDADLQDRLVSVLELDPKARIRSLSPGNAQKMAIILAVCHHPSLLLLDEPLSDLDPIARETMLAMLLERFRTDEMTIVISSHILRDVERIVDSVVCLDRGRLVAHETLDALQERYGEWILTSTEGRLPTSFIDPFVLDCRGDRHQAQLIVRDPAVHLVRFRERYGFEVAPRTLNLERVFPLLIGEVAS
ncbi:MAG TPA: ABC transporter ATP-binding protein, partial [Gemmatimonadaceae bacterium]